MSAGTSGRGSARRGCALICAKEGVLLRGLRGLVFVGITACGAVVTPTGSRSGAHGVTGAVSQRQIASAGSTGAASGAITIADAGVATPAPLASANPRLFAELPAPDDGYMVSRPMGFSRDDEYLGWAISRCDPCPVDFHFDGRTKPALDFGYFYEPGNPNGEALAKKHDAEVERKLKELGVERPGPKRALRGPFPYPELIFATAVDRDDFKGTVALLFGAKVEGYAPVFPVRVTLGPHSMFGKPMPAAEQARVAKLPPAERSKELRDWATQWLLRDPDLGYVNVTRDGAELGVVAVTGGSMWEEHGAAVRTSTKAFAAQVYNGTAMRFYQSSKLAQAAALFEKAEAADADESLYPYNLACAYARLGDVRARGALARAIQRGGDKIKARARADADFAGVSKDAWFADLVR